MLVDGEPLALPHADDHHRVGVGYALPVSVPRTKTFGLYSGDVSEVDKTMINPYIKSMFCYLL